MPTPRIRTVEGSCWACKQRRVICDLTSPVCDKCAKTGRRCEYGLVRLRWTDCVASRGRLAGKKVPLAPSRALTSPGGQDEYMLYFEHELLPRFNLSNRGPKLDLKALAGDPVLLQSVLAVSNAHRTYRGSPDSSSSLAKIRERNNALRVFRKGLAGTQSDELNRSLFMANVLFCILDGIIEPVTKDSATHHHLVGGKAILRQWGGQRGIIQSNKSPVPILMLSIFATMDLTHAMLIGDEPYFEAAAWGDFGDCEPWWGNVSPGDEFLETMGILCQLAELGHQTRHLNATAPISTLLSIQTTLEQQTLRQAEDRNKSPELIPWAGFCATYRYTASVYLYRALSGLTLDHFLVQRAVADFIELISGTDLTHNLHHCILFPLLICGTHCLAEEQRVQVRRSIGQTATYLSFESLRAMNGFLEKVWQQLDEGHERHEAGWWAYFEEIAHVTCLF